MVYHSSGRTLRSSIPKKLAQLFQNLDRLPGDENFWGSVQHMAVASGILNIIISYGEGSYTLYELTAGGLVSYVGYITSTKVGDLGKLNTKSTLVLSTTGMVLGFIYGRTPDHASLTARSILGYIP